MTTERPTVKCLVWDLDDTVWPGVLLENDGGAPTPAARRTLRALDERGILHAAASRGELAVATEHLRRHGIEPMFSAIKVGWGPKSEAVRDIAESLGIGVDTVAFVDNDPVERAEVAAALPEVRCYPAELIAELPELPEFAPAVITTEARHRRDYYSAERARRTGENEFAGSDADFLASLGLVLAVRRARATDLDRAHELTVRTHQLNTTGRTFDRTELRELCESPDHEVLVADLRDRFGGYGTIGLAVTQRRGTDSVLLLTLMSCRVMSRGVGGPFIGFLTERARAAGLRPTAEFVPTPVNRSMLITLRFAGYTVAATDGEQLLLAHDAAHRPPSAEHVQVVDTAPADLVSLLFGQIDRYPDRIAVVVGDRSVTYRELGEITAALARRLVAAGVRPGDVVLVQLPQSLDVVLALLAVLRAGAAWWVAEPDHPATTLHNLVNKIGCGVAVVAGPPPESLPRHLALVDIRDTAEPAPADLPGTVTADAPAYVITTSGSTGEPKAVLVSRANLAAMITARPRDHRDIDPVTFSVMRVLWDGWLFAFTWGLSIGATNVVPDEAAIGEVAALAALAERWQPTYLVASPSVYRLLLPALAGVRDSLRSVTLGGEVVPAAVVARHREVLPQTRLINGYGPTETTAVCLVQEIDDTTADPVPIGTALPGCAAYVLDTELQPVSPGTVGDLYLGGAQVVPGYVGRPGLTAAYFLPDPFAASPGARMYRTGDLATLDAAGVFEFRGRVDGQVKIRGVRVERAGVETVLEQHPAIREAAVIDSAGPDGVVRLTAFCVAENPLADPPGRQELIDFCRTRLATPAVPSRFRFLDAVPIVPTSTKRDEAALRTLASAPPSAAPPESWDGWTDTERELAQIWSEAVGHSEFDRADNFLDIGGDSHLIVHLHLRLDAKWPGAIRVGQLFDLTTIEEQAAAITAADPSDHPPTPMAFEL